MNFDILAFIYSPHRETFGTLHLQDLQIVPFVDNRYK
jgi:hypothetical protein